MAKYVIYTYQFSPITNFTLRIGEEPLSIQERMNRKQIFMQNILDALSENRLHFNYRGKDYNHLSCVNEQGIVVLKLANNTSTYVEDNFQRQTLPNHPSCYVIIDNRQDVQHILIEDNSNAFTETDVVQRILHSFFKKNFEEYGLEISINKAYQEREFWNTVRQFPQGVQMVRFQMSYPNLPAVWRNIGDMIRESSLETNSHNTCIEFHSQPGELLTLEESNDNLKGLVDASAEGGKPVILKINGIRAHKKTGHTEKNLEIDNIEAMMQPDMFESAFARISECLNQIFR